MHQRASCNQSSHIAAISVALGSKYDEKGIRDPLQTAAHLLLVCERMVEGSCHRAMVLPHCLVFMLESAALLPQDLLMAFMVYLNSKRVHSREQGPSFLRNLKYLHTIVLHPYWQYRQLQQHHLQDGFADCLLDFECLYHLPDRHCFKYCSTTCSRGEHSML